MNKITELPVVYKNKGMQIVGMLHKPNSNKKPPSAVFFHGCTTTKTEAHWIFVKLARALAERGIMVLRFDFRYSGDSEGNFENGRWQTWAVDTEGRQWSENNWCEWEVRSMR